VCWCVHACSLSFIGVCWCVHVCSLSFIMCVGVFMYVPYPSLVCVGVFMYVPSPSSCVLVCSCMFPFLHRVLVCFRCSWRQRSELAPLPLSLSSPHRVGNTLTCKVCLFLLILHSFVLPIIYTRKLKSLLNLRLLS